VLFVLLDHVEEVIVEVGAEDVPVDELPIVAVELDVA
jgi:hypothetical protein